MEKGFGVERGKFTSQAQSTDRDHEKRKTWKNELGARTREGGVLSRWNHRNKPNANILDTKVHAEKKARTQFKTGVSKKERLL